MRKALLIGINEYPKGNELSGCVNDMYGVNNLLERNEDGTLNFDTYCLPNCKSSEEARLNIKRLFENDDEIALLYFSGHGCFNGNDGELVFPDSIKEGNAYTGIRMSDILSIANNSKAKNKMIILDCCFSGNMGSPFKDYPAQLGNGVSILSASRSTETSAEKNGHGLFTEQFCNALSGGASDFTGNITIGGIYAFIDKTFGAWQQRPTFKTNVTEFVPLRTTKPKVDIDVIRNIVNLFSEANEEFNLNPSFEFTNSPENSHQLVKPYAIHENVKNLKQLQKLESIGFVEPVDEEHMYFAAMHSKSCRLTRLGKYYWGLVKKGQI